ncbi:MAG: hypothetical protein EOR51_12125 [Mesorhizobium sp.]|uniref:hypothetical protein n=1 Tax=Mesorhizobium sp. TaxID=1871066 RepID=UPI000FE87CF4|nr:hypothetical protein [Mesorhizobium sp.]RWK79648.1 MAG: hypothetical protein EOR50_05855 [Mesorhizobium sp.]RWK82424.1 MAG: hypothetical protein EOR51_12125 [Mesorhizobium sp.]RWL08757.1 MAG: hypothetical protein EOR55_03425 [Mesorhizobium sp.]
MPRAGGIYSAPPGTTAAPNTTIESAKYNALVADLVDDANNARPVAAGGSGSTTAVGGNDNFNTYSSDMLSAATVNLANATGTIVNVTGTVTITALGTVAAGAERVLIFAGILTLTHNASSLILPTGANITTAAGDVATMRSKGGGNWVCVGYQRANGKPLVVNVDDTFTVTSTDAGAAAAPVVDAYRNSASPAASDAIGLFNLTGKDSADNKTTYAALAGTILDPTNGSEDGRAALRTIVAGTEADRLRVEVGVYTPDATGGDKGAGTVNATAVYQNGARVSGAPDVVLEDQKASGTSGGTGVSTTWTTRDLNTEVRDPSGLCTLATNQFTMTVDGWVEWSTPVYATGMLSRLWNVTDGVLVSMGAAARADSSPNSGDQSMGGGPIVAGKAYAIQYFLSSSGSNRLGLAGSQGIEVYTRVKFWRIA